jgi:hypothetical protein
MPIFIENIDAIIEHRDGNPLGCDDTVVTYHTLIDELRYVAGDAIAS